MIIDELITLLGFNVKGGDKAEAYEAAIEAINDVAVKASVGIGALVASVAGFSKLAADSIADNYKWAKSNGINAESYQRLGQAAEMIGFELDSIKGDMEAWARTAQASGESIESIFLREAKSVEHLSASEQKAILSQRGYSEAAIQLIQSGEDNLKKMISQAQVLPESSLKSALQFQQTWVGAVSQIKNALLQGVASALPAIESVVKDVQEFMAANKDVIATNIAAFFKSVGIAVKIVGAVLSPLVWAVSALFKALDALSGGLGTYIVMVPLLTALFTAWAIAMGVRAYTAISNAYKQTTQFIGGLGKLWQAIRQSIMVKLLDNAATEGQIAVGKTKLTLEQLEKKNMLQLIVLRVKQTALKIKDAVATKASAAAQAIANSAFVKSIVQGAKWIATKTAQLALLIAEKAAIVATAVVQGVVTVATWLWTAAQWALNAAMLANPAVLIVMAIIAAIAIVIGLVVLVIKYWDEICAALKKAWDWIVNLGKAIGDAFMKGLKAYIAFYVKIWNGIKGLASSIWKTISGAFSKVWDGLKNGALKAFDAIGSFASSVWNKVKDAAVSIFTSISNTISSVLGPPIQWLSDVFTECWNGIKNAFIGVINFVLGAFSKLINTVIDGINLLIRGLNKVPGINIGEIGQVDWKIPTVAEAKQAGPPAQAVASASQVSNNNRNIVINNNNTVNTSASSGPAIANYLKNSNQMQVSGYGSVVTA